ncbi:MAG: phage integrase SAM-like domain-containing protein [Planctomycetota bacterium]
MSDGTARWLGSMDGPLKDELARVGLIEAAKTGRLGKLLDFHVERKRKENKAERTMIRLEQVRKDAVAFFGRDMPIHRITEGDAEDFRHWLMHERGPKALGEATTQMTCRELKSAIAYAKRKGVIKENPFDAVPTSSSVTPKDRLRHISERDARLVMAELQYAQWSLLFALARWGGLRVGSEPRALTWGDVNFDAGYFVVRSRNTKHYEGKD